MESPDGQPSPRLFSDLDKIEAGVDCFTHSQRPRENMLACKGIFPDVSESAQHCQGNLLAQGKRGGGGQRLENNAQQHLHWQVHLFRGMLSNAGLSEVVNCQAVPVQVHRKCCDAEGC